MTGMSMFIVLPLVVCIGGREETIVTEGSDLMSLVIWLQHAESKKKNWELLWVADIVV